MLGDSVIRSFRLYFARPTGGATRSSNVARYEHLPVYAEAYKLALHVEQQVGGFSNRQRAGLGADMRAKSFAMIKLIIRANSLRERRECLQALRFAVEEFLVLARLAKDVQAFSNLKAYEAAANLVLPIGSRTEG